MKARLKPVKLPCKNPNCRNGGYFETIYVWRKYCNIRCQKEASNHWRGVNEEKTCYNTRPRWKGDDGTVKEFIHFTCDGQDIVFTPLHAPYIQRVHPEMLWLMR